MKVLTGFFMAWSNFLALPCPYKKWDEKQKGTMIAFLPSIGIVVGLLWMLLFYVLVNINMPILFAAFLMTLYPYRVSGFFHLDGFMDCTDAIMSRRPLEDRQRILKDSRVGAFAVIAVIMLILGMYSAFVSGGLYADSLAFLVIPVISRGTAALSVMSFKPIGHSQYAGEYQEDKKIGEKVLVAIQMMVVMVIATFFTTNVMEIWVIFATVSIVGVFTCLYGKIQLGGFSGDIAGMGLVVSELAGIITLIFI
ncbi:MAG: adenosylcobinamide-GDP ribazoletransferase [Peptostreptococcaceae bacterium]|nr:adenosylcobinamide-GDP ribazoletransferase [Peptostreptococcaceae bacterium]